MRLMNEIFVATKRRYFTRQWVSWKMSSGLPCVLPARIWFDCMADRKQGAYLFTRWDYWTQSWIMSSLVSAQRGRVWDLKVVLAINFLKFLSKYCGQLYAFAFNIQRNKSISHSVHVLSPWRSCLKNNPCFSYTKLSIYTNFLRPCIKHIFFAICILTVWVFKCF